jgi:hypothetical protein
MENANEIAARDESLDDGSAKKTGSAKDDDPHAGLSAY